MARRTNRKSKEVKTKGRSALGPKAGGALSSLRAGHNELPSVGSTHGWLGAQAGDHEHLHQLIAERAYVLYERSGFQDGHDLEHWLEAERQIKKVRDQAA